MNLKNKRTQRNFKMMISFFVVLLLMMISAGCSNALKGKDVKNYVEPLDKKSVEMKTAELLTDSGNVFLFRYHTTDSFRTLSFYVTEYQNGKMVSKRELGGVDYSSSESPKEGMIAMVSYFEKGYIHLIEADNGGKYSTEIPILEKEENIEKYGRSAVSILEQKDIQYNREQSIVAFLYGENGISAIPIEEIEKGNVKDVQDGYIYCFSVEFDQ